MRTAFYTALGVTLLSSSLLMTSAWADTNTVSDTTTVAAQQQNTMDKTSGDAHHGSPLVLKLTSELNLTSQQQEQIKLIVKAAEPQMHTYMDQMLNTQRALHEAMNSDPYSADRVKQLAAQKGDLIAKMIVARAQMHQQIQSVLTPEQKAKFKQLMQQQRNKWQERQAKQDKANGL